MTPRTQGGNAGPAQRTHQDRAHPLGRAYTAARTPQLALRHRSRQVGSAPPVTQRPQHVPTDGRSL
jgi:hypothetical protein